MRISNFLSAIFVLGASAVTYQELSQDEITNLVAAHNRYRAAVSPGAAEMPKIAWDQYLVYTAEKFLYADENACPSSASSNGDYQPYIVCSVVVLFEGFLTKMFIYSPILTPIWVRTVSKLLWTRSLWACLRRL